MSDHQLKPEPAKYEPQVIGVLAEFAGPDELVAGARAIREKGYRKVEAFSPFPIHGIDEALAAPKPLLPYVVFGAGLTGCVVAILMQWYMNAFEAPIPFSGYDYGISGKPSWSLPANIPVTFELVVLFSAFTAFLGMIAFNQLPKFSNPLFRNERFAKATDNGFFLLIDSNDPQFATDAISSAFESIGSTHVEPLMDQPDEPMPGWIVPLGAVLTVAALIPLGLVVMNRNVHSETPRLSIWWDMDYQPKFKAQTVNSLFPDGRADRMAVVGTVARGMGDIDPAYQWGYVPEGEPSFETSLLQEEGDEPAGDEPADESEESEEPEEDTDAESTETEEGETDESDEPAAPPAAPAVADDSGANDPYAWVTEFPDPLVVDEKLMERGHRQYDIYCAVCHGYAGAGDGLVHKRAVELDQLATWAPPTSLHTPKITKYAVGKLYDTVANGNISGWTDQGTPIRGRMAGYKQQISVEDRWAIVLYIKAMQKSRLVTPDELTEKELATLK